MSLYSNIETPTLHVSCQSMAFKFPSLEFDEKRKLGFQPQWFHGVTVAALWWQQWPQFTINVSHSYHLPHCNVYLFLCPNIAYLRLSSLCSIEIAQHPHVLTPCEVICGTAQTDRRMISMHCAVRSNYLFWQQNLANRPYLELMGSH